LGPKLRYQSMTDDFHLPIRKLPMTREGYIALQKDLAHRAQVERPRIAERIRDAIADEDFGLLAACSPPRSVT
jgi:Transcription elongation factor, N-terminal